MLIDFISSAGCYRNTITPPSPVHPTAGVILSCCVIEVRYGHSGAGSTQERGIWSNGRESVGCGLPSAPGGVWGKRPETKLQRWEHGQGQSAPGPSLISKPNNTAPSTQVLFMQQELSVMQLYWGLQILPANPWYWGIINLLLVSGISLIYMHYFCNTPNASFDCGHTFLTSEQWLTQSHLPYKYCGWHNLNTRPNIVFGAFPSYDVL